MCVVRLFRASQPKGQIDNDGDFLMHKSIPTAPSICPPIFISFAGAWLFKHPCPQEFVIWEEKLQAVPPGGGGGMEGNDWCALKQQQSVRLTERFVSNFDYQMFHWLWI